VYPDGLGIFVEDDEIAGETDIDLLCRLSEVEGVEYFYAGVLDEETDLSDFPIPPPEEVPDFARVDGCKLKRLFSDAFKLIGEVDPLPVNYGPIAVADDAKDHLFPGMPVLAYPERVTLGHDDMTGGHDLLNPPPKEEGKKKGKRKKSKAWQSLLSEQGYNILSHPTRRLGRKRPKGRNTYTRAGHSGVTDERTQPPVSADSG
jgi:hypothetical protein